MIQIKIGNVISHFYFTLIFELLFVELQSSYIIFVFYQKKLYSHTIKFKFNTITMKNKIRLISCLICVILISCKKENKDIKEEIIGDTLSESDNDFLESISTPNPALAHLIGYDGAPLGFTKSQNASPLRNSNTMDVLTNFVDGMITYVQSLSDQKSISHAGEGSNKPQHMGFVYSYGQRDMNNRLNPPAGNDIHRKYAVFGTDCSGLMVNLLRNQGINMPASNVANFESTLRSAILNNNTYKDIMILENLGHIPESETKSGDFIFWIKPEGNHIGMICNTDDGSKIMYNSNGTGSPQTEADQDKNLGPKRGVHPIVASLAIHGSGYWGTSYKILRLKSKDPNVLQDADGNIYKTVTIGTQIWMQENLRTTHYNDGTIIPTGLSNSEWETTTNGAFAIYGNDNNNNNIYGKLYNFYAVSTGKLAPIGWHIPSEDEWNTLNNYLGNEGISGGKLKSTNLWTISPHPERDGTNSSGFTALPGGDRYIDGNYYAMGDSGWWWSNDGWMHALGYDQTNTYSDFTDQHHGFSIRCIKN